jgi:endonuclease/exonuclease/phosphatase family metal-dependent hydrolase
MIKRLCALFGNALFFLFAPCFILVLVAPFVDPRTFFIPSILGIGFLYWLVAGCLLLGVLLISKNKFRWLMLALILIGTTRLNRFVQLSNQIPKEESAITILSFNTQLFDLYKGHAKEDSRLNTFQKIKANNPDIVCFQEFYLAQSDKEFSTRTIAQKLGLPYYLENFSANRKKGQVTFSRYPLRKLMGNNYGGNGYQIMEVLIGKDTVNLINMHLASFKVNPKEIQEEAKDTKAYGNILARLKTGFTKRSKQLNDILEDIESFKDPILVVGDLNDTPNSYAYQQFSNRFTDAFCMAGKGVGNSYNGDLPSLRIDYIFSEPPFVTVEYKVLSNKKWASDHYPILAKVNL